MDKLQPMKEHRYTRNKRRNKLTAERGSQSSDEQQLLTSRNHIEVYIVAEAPKYFFRKYTFTAYKQSHLLE